MSYSPQELQTLRSEAEKIVLSACQEIDFTQISKVILKADQSPVTEVDRILENTLRRQLSKLLPDSGFIVEEGESDEKEINWTIDGIDQTKNFVGKLPLFYSQIALVKDGNILISIVYNPLSQQLFSSYLGGGVTLNGNSLGKLTDHSLSDSIIDLEVGSGSDAGYKIKIFSELFKRAKRVRVTAGAFSPYLVTGAVQAYVSVNPDIKVVDYAPRIGLFTEAGCEVLREETDQKILVAAPQNLYNEICSILGEIPQNDK